ncbi:hypothetical protein F2Q65_08945 [Thiohalocapsa marina]|uniref:PhoD-like phosphatase metallophosphatase domain-containing protein n=1 Tax=Thiohalocapsa marina TaxID=424902 RepID=A0A5M8FSN4_9GAMM|nr:alkaline phosphatase D family protein [Thiohalocapsa marina]KAA6185392.1 hypothetical protein F2Q65_08945 [Thiohalocapsa marina]
MLRPKDRPSERSGRRLAILACLTLCLAAGPGAGPAVGDPLQRAPAPVIAVGDVTAESAVLWVQADREGVALIDLTEAPPEVAALQADAEREHDRNRDPDRDHARAQDRPPEVAGPLAAPSRHFEVPLSARSDFTAKLRIDGLNPGMVQHWRAAVQGASDVLGEQARGRFRTAPAAYTAAAVHLRWGSDLAGQNVCRDAERGFEVFDAIHDGAPDLFVGLGDMIYADGRCEAVGIYGNAQIPTSFGPATDLAGFRAHWRYTRADMGLRRLLSQTAYYTVWDDHEVIKALGPLHDAHEQPPYTAGVSLMPIGMAALLEQNPIAEHPLTPKRLYRSVRWGQHLELLLLDTRQYRDPNQAEDTPERPKTMLGREQLTWLKTRLEESRATWVVVASSVPMSLSERAPEAVGRDGWANVDGATGYARELAAILEHAATHGRNNLVFISGGVRFGAALRYRPFSERPGFVVHEFLAPPLSAAIRREADIDPDLGVERLFLHAPASGQDIRQYEQARDWFGFGELRIDGAGLLSAALRGADGRLLHELRLSPASPMRLAAIGFRP